MKEQLISFIKTKNKISIPEIQDKFSCSYAYARNAVSALSLQKLVSREADGVFFAVNTAVLVPRELSEEECEQAGRMLTADAFELLLSVSDGKEQLTDEMLRSDTTRGGHVGILLELNLVHCFEGQYFCSVSKKALEGIGSFCNEYCMTSALIAHIAHPALVFSIEFRESADDLLGLGMLPEKCKKYISSGLERYKKNKKEPELGECAPKDKSSMRSIKFDLVESFIGAYEFDTRAKYDKMFKKELAVMEACRIVSEEVKEIAREAYREFGELTIANIREIHNILKKGSKK